jgi:hypothetical protein
MRKSTRNSLVTLPLDAPVWERTFTVNPLVLIGTKESYGDKSCCIPWISFGS